MRLFPGAIAILCLAQAPARPAWRLEFTALPSPAAADSSGPQLTVSEKAVLLSWIERSGPRSTLKFAERATRGAWSAPVTVASGDNWFVNWADVPSVMRLSDGTLAAHWLQKSGPGTYAYDVRLSFSRDDGKTWSAAASPHHDGTPTEHGFASLFGMPGSGLGLVWLDGRAMTGGHAGHGSGEMSLRSAVFDSGRRQESEAVVDARVCECCPTAAAITAEGPIVAYRDRSAEEVRDISIVRMENGRWSAPQAVHRDNWKIAACPVNGPALSARDRLVVIGWFTMKNDQGQAYAAFSSDAGRSFGAPIRLDEGGSLGRLDVELLPDGSALAAYIDASGPRPALHVRRIDPSGQKSSPLAAAALESNRTSGYPRMAVHGDEVVLAWVARDGTTMRVKTSAGVMPVLRP